VIEEALRTPGPAIVEALVDPFEPPMPAKVTMEQAAHFAKALLRGEPNRERIALTVLSDRVRELI
jgi:pyruvate dehydrogenase (quinone)